ncbi:MAG: glycoside hydrolase family 5 protein [Aristaeellaceae bacterium]
MGSMQVGVNLGNALDAIGGETVWGNPPTTRAMIHAIADKGFRILRIPTTWTGHLGPAPAYRIDPAWLARVREVVEWSMAEGTTTILNTHHDNDLFQPVFSNMPVALPAFIAVWQQIAVAFADMGPGLVFESMNEPRPKGVPEEWTGGTLECRQCINVLQQAFVDTVRATGGLNASRRLLVTTSAAVISDSAFDGFILPRGDNLALALHSYQPWSFCYNRPDRPSTAVFGPEEAARIDETFQVIRRLALPLGVPVWLTEFGSVTKVDSRGRHNDGEVARYAAYFLGKARELNIPCLWWDNNFYESGDEWFGLLDRETLAYHRPLTVQALTDAMKD